MKLAAVMFVGFVIAWAAAVVVVSADVFGLAVAWAAAVLADVFGLAVDAAADVVLAAVTV